MERSRVTLITLICVLFSRISGAEVEMRVRPGDDITLYSDCVWKIGLKAVWFRNSSLEHQPPLLITTEDLKNLPRYSLEWSPCTKTHNLLVKNITESDLGLYYCAHQEKKTTGTRSEDVYHYGNRTIRLSLVDTTVCANPNLTTPTPPVSDCSVCWKLLVSVCPVCVLLSSTCVYCICRKTTKVVKKNDVGKSETTENQKTRKHGEVGGDGVCYASLDLPSRGQKRLKKKRVKSSDFSTYSEVRTDKM